MASVSFYQTLQVAPDASQADIAAAYRRLARQIHPDLNPSPDAHRQMQVLNEAYNTLRHPERRLRYDESLAARQVVRNGAQSRPQPASQRPANRTTLSVAWLSYQKRIGDEIVFTIGHADNMADLLATLQQRIPPAGRRYEIAHNRWHVHVAHEDVLRTLFRNYAPVPQSPSPVPTAQKRRPAPAARPIRRTSYTHARTGERKAWVGVGLAVAAALAIYILIFGRVLLSESAAATGIASATVTAHGAVEAGSKAPPSAGTISAAPASADFVFPDDCTPSRIDQAPTYFREACKTLESDPRLITPASSRPYALASTRVASNIRSGPDTRFPVLTTTPPGARIQLVGYTVNRGYVWFLTNFGGWIRSDLLIEPPGDLPSVGM